MMKREKRLVKTCKECGTASCAQGDMLCWDSQDADVELKTVSDLRKLKLEHSSWYSIKRTEEVYGVKAPFGYSL